MVKRIDSDALGILTKALGLSGSGSPMTELADGVVDQALSVNEIVRRSRTLAGASGIYAASMSNVHTDAETITTSVNVYNVAAGATSIWPVPVPEQFDAWLLGASMRRVSGTGTITSLLAIQFPAASLGWGVDDSGVAITAVDPMGLVSWNGLITTATIDGNRQGSGGPYIHLGIRIPRGTGASTGTLRFSSVSSATSTWKCNLILGLFPVSLGQDGIV